MVERIVELLKEKEALLLKFEEISKLMVGDDTDLLESLDDERLLVLEEMKDLDLLIKKTYENDIDADKIGRAISNQDDRANVDPKYIAIFDKAQENFVIISRLQTFQENFINHLSDLKAKLLVEMKQNNQQGKVVKYLNAFDNQVIPEGSLLSNRKA